MQKISNSHFKIEFFFLAKKNRIRLTVGDRPQLVRAEIVRERFVGNVYRTKCYFVMLIHEGFCFAGGVQRGCSNRNFVEFLRATK